jgi:hypothetical protein
MYKSSLKAPPLLFAVNALHLYKLRAVFHEKGRQAQLAFGAID